MLSLEFGLKDLGPTKRILGIDIHKDREKCILIVSQKGYLHKVVDMFTLKEAKSVNTPTKSHFKLTLVNDQNVGS